MIIFHAAYETWEDIQSEASACLLGSLISSNIICFLLSVGLRNTATTSPWSNNRVCYGWWNNLNIQWCAKQNLINTTPNPTTMVSKLILCYATHALTHTHTHPLTLCQFSLAGTRGHCIWAQKRLQTAVWKTDSMSIYTVEQLYSLAWVCDFTVSAGRTWLNHTLQLPFTGVFVCHRKTQKMSIFSCCLYNG